MKKKNVFLMVCMLLLSGMAVAQMPKRGNQHMTPEMRAERMTQKMVRELLLNEQQALQVKQVNLDFMNQVNARKLERLEWKMQMDSTKSQTREDKKELKETMRQEIKTAMAQRDEKLKEILTPQQYEMYQQQLQNSGDKAKKMNREMKKREHRDKRK